MTSALSRAAAHRYTPGRGRISHPPPEPSMAMSPCPPPDFAPRAPRVALPPGATDCHAHVFGPAARYAYAEPRSYTPPDCSLGAYRHMLATIGCERAVLVQPSVYGTDNAAHLAALGEAGPDFRMVAVVGAEVAAAELERMHAAGVRGVRYNLVTQGGLAVDGLARMAERLAPLGWHLQLFVQPDALAQLEPQLAALPVPVVIDHMGHVTTDLGLAHPGFQALLRLLRGGNGWVKLSGAYRTSRQAAPPFADVVPFAQALIAAAPERCVWGSDWPHPMVNDRPMPNDGDLANLLADWAPDPAQRRRILVENPARLYGFAQ
jgi:predicted TIM-barrel fold metal-dependent hydrolase